MESQADHRRGGRCSWAPVLPQALASSRAKRGLPEEHLAALAVIVAHFPDWPPCQPKGLDVDVGLARSDGDFLVFGRRLHPVVSQSSQLLLELFLQLFDLRLPLCYGLL